MTVSNELGYWIDKFGNERKALNVALAQLKAAEAKLDVLRNTVLYIDCPCGAVILPVGHTCPTCGHEATLESE